MVIVLLFVSGVATLSLLLVRSTVGGIKEQGGSRADLNSMYVCEGGVAHAVADLAAGGSGQLGSEEVPVVFGSASYWVVATAMGDGRTSLIATSREGRARARVEVVVRQAAAERFAYGAFGDEFMTMDSNAFVDSYDSESPLGSYADQAVNGSGTDTYANPNGDVGSNGNVLLEQNSSVFGDAAPGPSGSISVLGNATVSGSTAPLPELASMPPITVPAYVSSGDLTVSGSYTIGAGVHGYEEVDVQTGATLFVTGPATLVFSTFELASNASMTVDATAGPVEIYVLGDFVLNSNTTIASTTLTPADISFFLLSDNVIDPDDVVDLDEVDFDSNAKLYGTIYAPNAAISINSNFELFGAVVARSLELDSNCRIHFDEALTRAGASGESSYEVLCWRELSANAALELQVANP